MFQNIPNSTPHLETLRITTIQYDVKLQTSSNLLQEWNIGTNTWIPAPWRKRSSLKGRRREGRREKISNKTILSAPTPLGNEAYIAFRAFKLNGAKTVIPSPKCLGRTGR